MRDRRAEAGAAAVPGRRGVREWLGRGRGGAEGASSASGRDAGRGLGIGLALALSAVDIRPSRRVCDCASGDLWPRPASAVCAPASDKTNVRAHVATLVWRSGPMLHLGSFAGISGLGFRLSSQPLAESGVTRGVLTGLGPGG